MWVFSVFSWIFLFINEPIGCQAIYIIDMLNSNQFVMGLCHQSLIAAYPFFKIQQNQIDNHVDSRDANCGLQTHYSIRVGWNSMPFPCFPRKKRARVHCVNPFGPTQPFYMLFVLTLNLSFPPTEKRAFTRFYYCSRFSRARHLTLNPLPKDFAPESCTLPYNIPMRMKQGGCSCPSAVLCAGPKHTGPNLADLV